MLPLHPSVLGKAPIGLSSLFSKQGERLRIALNQECSKLKPITLRRRYCYVVVCLITLLIGATRAKADLTYSYTILDPPGSVGGAAPTGINASGQVAGYFTDASGATHGFVYSGGIYTVLNVAGLYDTYITGISDTGRVTGYFFDGTALSSLYGFVYSGGTHGSYTVLNPPGASTSAIPTGINASGQVAGYFSDNVGEHGFVYSGGSYTVLNPPGGEGYLSYGNGINNAGQVVGSFLSVDNFGNGDMHGFVYRDGAYTDLSVPGANDGIYGTYGTGINASGQVTGYFYDAHRIPHGFVYSGGTHGSYTVLNALGASGDTVASGINASGQVVGYFDYGQIFVYSGGTHGSYTVLNPPGASTSAIPTGINASGQVVGYFDYANGFIATPSFLGVDVSQGTTTVSKYRSLSTVDGKQFVIANAWTGFSQFYEPLDNLNAAQGGGITNLAAYMELNYFSGSDFSGSDNSGRQQVQNAFASVSGFPIAFMAVGVEPLYHNHTKIPVPPNVDFVQRIADAVQSVRSQGVPAIIYTREGTSQHWHDLTGDSQEIQGVPLWDVDPLNPAAPYKIVTPTDPIQPTLDGFTGYGAFTTRIGRQYVLSIPDHPAPTLEGIGVDEDIFDPSAFSLPKPPIGCLPALSITEVSTRSGSNLVVLGTLNDNAPSSAPLSDALATRITAATLTTAAGRTLPVSTTTALPIRLNTIPVGGGALFQLNFPASVGASGTRAVLRIQGTYGGGTFAFSLRETLP